MFSPRWPGVMVKEGCFEDGVERWVKREESIRWTCRGEEVGVLAQLVILAMVLCDACDEGHRAEVNRRERKGSSGKGRTH